MDPEWIKPENHILKIKKKVRRSDTLICLGDCGKLEWFDGIKAHKVLIKGNHDDSAKDSYKEHFDEVYDGPLFIGEKILLSHEAVPLPFCVNIHGHEHASKKVQYTNRYGTKSVNLAANVCGYNVFDLGAEIKKGLLAGVDNIHRMAIDNATENKEKREKNLEITG
jgi:calcineurin-like phosphoesterase family protein